MVRRSSPRPGDEELPDSRTGLYCLACTIVLLARFPTLTAHYAERA